MAIPFECANCRSRYEVADGMAGKTILCRQCEQRVPVRRPGATAPRGAPAASAATLTRRNALLIAGSILPAVLLGGLGAYYWNRPLPWERVKPRERKDEGPGRGRFRGAPPGEGQATEGQPPPESQPAEGQPR
jgi:hypothetical protein